MGYDFVTQVDRTNSGSSKWNGMLEKNPNAKGIVPFSVADMELKNPPEIIEGLQNFLAQDPILGYTNETDKYYQSVIDWMKKKHHWKVEKEWIVTTPGVVAALSIALEALTKPKDSVLILTPVYYPFRKVIQNNGLNCIESVLKEEECHYTIDFDDFEMKAADPSCKVFILCSPHNPIARVWTKEELEKMSKICLKHHVFMISDEIHHDLVFHGHQHTVLATLSKEVEEQCIVCTSCSKTFNLAGLQVSNIMISNPQVREAFNEVKKKRCMGHLNILSYEACILAYTKCDAWMKEMLEHIEKNEQVVLNFLAKELPKVSAAPLEGTYLLWLDLRKLGWNAEDLEKRMLAHDLYFDEGAIFGEGGAGFERINLACPTETLIQGLERLKIAIQQ